MKRHRGCGGPTKRHAPFAWSLWHFAMAFCSRAPTCSTLHALAASNASLAQALPPPARRTCPPAQFADSDTTTSTHTASGQRGTESSARRASKLLCVAGCVAFGMRSSGRRGTAPVAARRGSAGGSTLGSCLEWRGRRRPQRADQPPGPRRDGGAPPRAAVVPAVPAGGSSAGAAGHIFTTPSVDAAFVAAFQRPLQQAQGRANAHSDGCHSTECAICMAEVQWGASAEHTRSRGAASKTVALLSCSHILHAACVASWEKFQAGDATCPVCRASYSRCDLDAEALRQLQ